MKIVHFSDTHLGYNDLDILNNENINQIEADGYNAFMEVIENIKKIKPDYIIHTGDLFHRTSPSNRAITFALEAFKTIDELNIPFIIIAGNHSTPRTNLSAPILKIFDNFKNIYTSYSSEYKKFEFKDAVFHTIPHIVDEIKAKENIEKIKKIDNKKNILMLHCSVGSYYLMQEFGEWVFPKDKESIFLQMDYVALGHWHGFTKVANFENVYYSGSTQRTSLNDKRNSKGFIELTLKDRLEVEFKEIKSRKIIVKEIDCADGCNLELLDNKDTKDTIVEVVLKNLTPTNSIDISNDDIKEIFSDAFYVLIKRKFKNELENKTEENINALSLEELFLEQLKDEIENQTEYKSISLKVKELFSLYEEKIDDTI